MSELHIFTYGSDISKMDTLLASAHLNGVELKVRGDKVPWRGNLDKLSRLHEELQSLHPEDIFMFVDGYDVAIVSDTDYILEQFYSYDAPFVISAEKTCWPDDHVAMYYPESDSDYAYVNSGTYIGYVWAVSEYFNYCAQYEDYRVPPFDGYEPIPHAGSDQRALTTWFLNHPEEAVLDVDQKIFSTLANTPLESFELIAPNKVTNLETQHQTGVIHGNSPAGMKTLIRLWFRLRSLPIIK
jgi:hypothetical protein